MMLNWFRKGLKARPAPQSRAPAVIERVSGHVQAQIIAFTGRQIETMPDYGHMTDLLVGAYVWGLLEGCLRNLPGDDVPVGDVHARTAVMAAEVCSRVLGPKRMRWVRGQLPQWDGPRTRNLPYRWALARMRRDGARDGRYLAASDPLCFAKAGSLLAMLLASAETRA
ncbi:hypothetical protein [Microvirga guangxiensis]|nr:hypothetical protein [Microvirga guangxiensis]